MAKEFYFVLLHFMAMVSLIIMQDWKPPSSQRFAHVTTPLYGTKLYKDLVKAIFLHGSTTQEDVVVMTKARRRHAHEKMNWH